MNFIDNLLLAYGQPIASITRLQERELQLQELHRHTDFSCLGQGWKNRRFRVDVWQISRWTEQQEYLFKLYEQMIEEKGNSIDMAPKVHQ